MKPKKTAMLIVLLAAFAMFAGYAHALAGCCCDFELGLAQTSTHGLGYLEHTDCADGFNFVLPNTMDIIEERTCADICAARAEGYVPPEAPPPEGIGCGDATYDEAPINLQAVNVRGEKRVILYWDTKCPAMYFTVARCEGMQSECEEGGFSVLADGSMVGEPIFTDGTLNDLLWNEDYTYKITAYYINSGESEPAFVEINTGDIECWGKTTDEKFCLSSYFYQQPFIIDYLKSSGYGVRDSGDFTTGYANSVRDVFFDKFNKAYSCWPNNELSNPDDVCARYRMANGFCNVDSKNNLVQCVQPCEPTSASNYFGFFYAPEECEGYITAKKYCYIDRSKTVVNKCYPCNPEMKCHDYLTESACVKDNCGAAKSKDGCKWKAIYPDIGVGVCIDPIYSNCELCTFPPSNEASEAFNEIYDQCSQEKCGAMAVLPANPCRWKNWTCEGCGDITCNGYTDSIQCASTASIQLTPNHSIDSRTMSNDQCRIGVCQWNEDRLPGRKCFKNADGQYGGTGNEVPDCAAFTDAVALEKCEKDYIAPVATLIATGAQGIVNRLNINIFDKTYRDDPGEYKTGTKAAGYKTYFCHYPQGGSCDIHSSPFVTSAAFLTLHNTWLMESQTNITKLAVGDNYITYYVRDPASNLGIVKTLKVYACEKCVGPQIINYYIANGIKVLDDYYTNEVRPILRADFDVDAEITTAEIDSPEGFFVSALSYSSPNSKNYTFATQAALPEGNYVFRINAKDSEGTLMNQEFILPFILDLSAGEVVFTANGEPADGARINDVKANVKIVFAEPVSSITIQMNGRNITGSFTTTDNQQFTANNLGLDEGTTVISVIAKDFAQNDVLADATIFVNGRPPVIRLKEPTYGVSSEDRFDIVAETLNEVNCRYLFDVPVPPDFNFNDLERFDDTGGTLHTINDFGRIAPIPGGETGKHDLHVFCIDPLWGMANATFKLSVDKKPPVISSAYATPEIIMEAIEEGTYRTQFKVITDELTFCRYSAETDSYGAMEGEFPDFRQEPPVSWPNTVDIPKKLHDEYIFVYDENRSYTYYVGCEDLGGNPSGGGTGVEVRFSIDLSRNFSIESHTPVYWNTSTITIAVESNKRAYCFYGTSESAITSPFQEDGEYNHKTNLANIGIGRHTFYVRCNTRYLAQEISQILPVLVVVDTTPPAMVNVSDDGPIPSDPEFSYLTNQLRANWLGKDNESNVTRYYYKVETFYGRVPVINWTPTTIGNEWTWITNLNLVEDTTYRVLAKAQNAAGLIGEPLDSNGVTISLGKLPQICNNTLLDAGNETDVDCGGICPPCGEGMACLSNTDCQSGFCKSGFCTAAACDDTIRNGDETDVDCGGSCSPCGLGGVCLTSTDCESGNCQNGICGKPDPCFNGIQDGTETDVDCGGSCAVGCSAGKSCVEPGDCISSLCVDNICLQPRGVGEECQRDIECSSGLVCKDGICKEPRKEAGEFCNSDYECEEGLLCYNSRCSLDSDGDGMPDDWELTYGLDPNDPSDALSDKDGDEVSNIDEYKGGTNPEDKDTDGDAWFDGEELKFSTDPLDSESRPSAWQGLLYHPLDYWWLWLLILLLVILIIVVIIFGYRTTVKIVQERKKKKPEEKKAIPEKKLEKKPAEKPEKEKPLTPEEKEELKKRAEEERKIAEKLEKVRELVKKKAEAPAEEITKKDWVDIKNVMLPLRKRRPEEVKPVFRELDTLKKGKLGVRGRKKALTELERLLGKKAKAEEELAKAEEKLAKKKKVSPFERIAALGGKGRRFMGKKDPLLKLKMMALAALPPEERKKFLERLVLLRTGKLTAAERKELFEKLKIIADYYKKHRSELELELLSYEHPRKAAKRAKPRKKRKARKKK